MYDDLPRALMEGQLCSPRTSRLLSRDALSVYVLIPLFRFGAAAPQEREVYYSTVQISTSTRWQMLLTLKVDSCCRQSDPCVRVRNSGWSCCVSINELGLTKSPCVERLTELNSRSHDPIISKGVSRWENHELLGSALGSYLREEGGDSGQRSPPLLFYYRLFTTPSHYAVSPRNEP